MSLTEAQKSFLFSQKVPLGEVFDATGLSRAVYQKKMEDEGKLFAFGVSPCKKSGHTLRSKAGHCIECDTSKIAYQRRHHIKGIVYMAGSHSLQRIKIGCTNDLSERTRSLTQGGYGGASDWEILCSAHAVGDAGAIESKIQNELKNYNVFGSYIKQGKKNECYELFQCDFKMAYEAFKAYVPANVRIRIDNEERLIKVYGFK